MIQIKRSGKVFLVSYVYVSVARLISDLSKSYAKNGSVIQTLEQIKRSLIRNLQSDKIPQFCAKLVFLFSFIELGLLKLSHRFKFDRKKHGVTYLSAFLSAYISYTDYTHNVVKNSPSKEIAYSRLNNISIELTALVLARAIDTLIRGPLVKSKPKRSTIYDSTQFTLSCFVIMFSWFYYPQNMQSKYHRWITKMANMDNDLVKALRYIRNNQLHYGVSGEYTTLLENTAEKMGLPREYGNTNTTIPIPCELVHANTYKSCEIHSLWRFWRGMKSAMLIYLPLNTVLSLRKLGSSKTSKEGRGRQKLGILYQIILKSLRSSAFLASFIALNWYSVCLVRKRIGPKLFPNATSQQIEDTWGPACGSLICGLSILLEEKQRRPELALFGKFFFYLIISFFFFLY